MNAPTSLQPKRSKLLIASLALNFAVAGLVGGAFLERHRLAMPNGNFNIGRTLGDPGLRGFVKTLSKERHVALRRGGEAFRKNFKPLRQAVQQARTEATAAMKSEPFDPAQVEKAMESLILAETALRRASVAVLIGALSQMTSVERAQFDIWRKAHEHSQPGPPQPDVGNDQKRSEAVDRPH